jgi:3-hydroxyacyl-CoA dehydrogenase / enoyl-CoA hydratase / 3-hydroxybutyryl-CoA epimerase / enoyl-CoA isomerase
LLAELVAMGRMGRKSGAGFRRHDSAGSRAAADPSLELLLGHDRPDQETPDQTEITDRLFLPMLLEAIRVIEEGIARGPADVDLGLRLGLGFPASRGGILGWCDAEGAASILNRLARYRALGPAFHPPATLVQMAGSGTSFHPHSSSA